ncbi:MAG: hypothetical protein NTX28_10230 [Novosphingobium sp.]|nr:hypothetical protein [Novosphingobium sp.]
MAKFWKSKTILAKIEAVYATDSNPTGAANAILAEDVTYTPMEGDWIERNTDTRYFGAKPGLGANFRSVLTLSIPLVGSGVPGTAPAWGPLLRACNVAQVATPGVKVEYTPVTDNAESATLYFDVDGTKHIMLGTRGNAVIKVTAGGIPMLTFTLTSLFTVPAEAAKPTPDYSGFIAPQVGSKANTPTFTIGGAAMVLRELELDLGRDVQPRMLIGQEQILIVDAKETLKAQIEAVALNVYNPFAIAIAGTLQAIALVHGTVAGRITAIDFGQAQQKLPTYQEQQGILEWPLEFSPLPAAGNDQWKITLN